MLRPDAYGAVNAAILTSLSNSAASTMEVYSVQSASSPVWYSSRYCPSDVTETPAWPATAASRYLAEETPADISSLSETGKYVQICGRKEGGEGEI